MRKTNEDLSLIHISTKKHIKNIMIEVDRELFTYLININKYDHKILELYVMLEEIVGY